MEQAIRDRFNDNILAATAHRYNLQPTDLEFHGGFESFIYTFTQNNKPYILRLTHSRRRTPNLIHAEIDWLHYLAQNGAAVAAPYPSAHNNLVEQIPDDHDGHFLATAFDRAPGTHATGDKRTPQLIHDWGAALGQMHHLAQNYTPTNPHWQRPHWDSPDIFDLNALIPPADTRILDHAHQLINQLQQLPRSPQTYGLVHQDAHAGNFFVTDDGKLTFFDFDDSAYTWFANDIAIVLFYAASSPMVKPQQMIPDFMHTFMTGYHTQHQLPADWWQPIPQFLKLREILLYAVINRSFTPDNMPGWPKWFMKKRRQRLENNTPYFDIDFSFLQ
ncbi:MAG TPA: phosphotransferase [Anaerolineae bacterium]|nr:phosphotransferase [Anaerolineae bacterium]